MGGGAGGLWHAALRVLAGFCILSCRTFPNGLPGRPGNATGTGWISKGKEDDVMYDVVKADPGESIDIAAGRAIKTAKEKGSGVFLELNDIRVLVSPGSLAGDIGTIYYLQRKLLQYGVLA